MTTTATRKRLPQRIIDMIVGHCGDDPQPGWLDQTQATEDAGAIGRWTGNGRF